MDIKRYCITLIILLIGIDYAYSQENRTEICIDFRVNSTVIDSTYSNNAQCLQEMIEFLRNIRQDSTITIIEVSFCGSASPEDSYQLNRRLARGRLLALEKLVRMEVDIPDSIIIHSDNYISWNYLKSQVENSTLVKKDEVIAILGEEARLEKYHRLNEHVDSRILKLQALDGGKTWQQMHRLFFERMRNAWAVFITCKRELPPVQEPVIPSDTIEVEPPVEVEEVVPDTTAIAETTLPEVEGWTRKLHLKTNAIGLGMGIANVAAEVDLYEHWSFSLPIYYSAWDYFKSTIKFRTFAVQPELRYWLSENNDGLFAGAHFGLAYYNFALDGNYRYQDHDGKSPALGGGLNVGYRMPVSKNGLWHIEFSLGAGVYGLHYDKFYNVNNGRLIDTYRKTYFGIDNLAVNILYRFDLKQRRK